MPTTTYTADGTPVIAYNVTEWDEMRARRATRDPEAIARELEARKAEWSAKRRAYEAAQAKATEDTRPAHSPRPCRIRTAIGRLFGRHTNRNTN